MNTLPAQSIAPSESFSARSSAALGAYARQRTVPTTAVRLMHRVLSTTFALIATLASLGASAQYHHICFEGARELDKSGTPVRTLIAACQDDNGGICTIVPGVRSGGLLNQVTPFARQPVDLYPTNGAAYREVLYFAFTHDARIEFEFDGGKVRRGCTARLRESSPPRGRLTGFSTDASGQVSTGVWRFHAVGGLSDPSVPGGFVALGGGSAADQPDAFVSRSYPHSAHFGWTAEARGEFFNSPFPPTVPALPPGDRTFGYVVGVRLGDLAAADLRQQLGLTTLLSRHQVPTAAPSATVRHPFNATTPSPTLGPDAAVLGGGVFASATGLPPRHVATASVPVPSREWFACILRMNVLSLCSRPVIGGWHAEARSPQGLHTDEVAVRAVTLPWTLDVPDALTGHTSKWRLRTTTVDASSRPDVSPAASVSGLRGVYAVTAAGAEVLWRGPTGNDATRPAPMLSRIEPRLDFGGATAAAQAGSLAGIATPAALRVQAIGLRLIDAKTADEPEVRPEVISTIDLCRADSALSTLPICQKAPPLMPPWQVCKEHPYLPKYGYCDP